MVDVALLFGRLVLIGLLYLFLLAAARAGLGQVRGGTRRGPKLLGLAVVSGPPELTGVTLPLDHTITVGRSPDADLTLADEFVSAHHARVAPASFGGVLEDLGSTNGTRLNGHPVGAKAKVGPGDVITVGDVSLKVVPL